MSDLYPLAGLLFFLMFTIIILGDISINVAEYKCPGFKKRYICERCKTNPNFHKDCVVCEDIELPSPEDVASSYGEHTSLASGIEWMEAEVEIIRNRTTENLWDEFVKQFDLWRYGVSIAVDKAFIPVQNINEFLFGSIKEIYATLSVTITAIGSKCAGLGMISTLILSPIVITLIIFILRLVRGS